MASSSDLRSVEARIKLLLNAQLKSILRDQGLAVSGVKTELQIRLLARKAIRSLHMVWEGSADALDLNKLAAAGDTLRIDRIRRMVNGPGDGPSSTIHHNTPASSSSPHQPPSLPQQHTSSGFGMPPNPPFASGNGLTLECALIPLMKLQCESISKQVLSSLLFNL